MRTLSILLFLLSTFAAFSQDLDDAESNTIKYVYDTLMSPSYQPVNRAKVELLVNPSTLNAYFNKNVSSYLTGEEDVSLFGTYAVVDAADGRLFLGKNFATTSDQGFVRSMFTAGFHLDIDDGFSKVVEDASLQNNSGMSFQFTKFSRGYVKYYEKGKVREQVAKRVTESINTKPGQRTLLDVKRHGMAAEVKKEIEESFDHFKDKCEELSVLIKKLESADKPDVQLINASKAELIELKENFIKEQKKVAANSFYEKELEEFETKQYFHYSNQTWYSINFYLPITLSEYTVAQDVDAEIETVSYYPWKLSASFNGLIDSKKTTWFWFVGYTLENTNAIKRSSLASVSISEYRTLGGMDTLRLANLSSDDIYVGDYENIAQSSVSGQIGLMFPECENLNARFGTSLTLEQIVSSDYSPFNAELGFPISLSGREKDSPVNIKPTFLLPDLFKKESEDEVLDKLVFGISLALPFGNTIY